MYTLELVTSEVERTTWWKDENHKEPANVWWITGPGVSRPATVEEIDLWRQIKAPLDPSPTPHDFRTWGFYCDYCARFFESEELCVITNADNTSANTHKLCGAISRYISYQRKDLP